MRVIHVLRKPLDNSVAQNVLEHGCGALNIDTTRIRFSGEADKWATGSGGTVYRAYMDGSGQVYRGEQHQPTQNTSSPHDEGRWPANLILEHLSGCRMTGTQTVKAKQLTAGRRTIKWGVGEGGDTYEKGTGALFATEDGLDRAPVWDCEPGCPVANLDDQSGDRPVSGAAKTNRPAVGGQTGGCVVSFGIEKGNGTLHNDSGGASRFFKQVGGEATDE